MISDKPNKPDPIDWIRRNLGISRKAADALMPPAGKQFPAAVVDPYSSGESWAAEEYRKEMQGWEIADK